MTYCIPYTGNLPWLTRRTVFFARHGSHAYGTNIATSDEDFRGVAIPPSSYFHGFAHAFEQAEMKSPDVTIFGLRKFMQLAADCNPNVLEILFVEDSDVLVMTPLGERLRAARDLFLSKKAKHTYAGYATGQLRRIRGHMRWLRDPMTAPPTRAEFGLPERTVIPQDQIAAARSAVEKKLKDWNLDFVGDLDPASRLLIADKMADSIAEMHVTTGDLWIGAARAVGFESNFIELLDRERQYHARHKEWEQYQAWKVNRNAARAELEAKFGYDLKHGMHLVRLLKMCREILTTGKVLVRRPDAEELLAIRRGAWTIEQLIEWSDRENAELDAIAKASKLPDAPDRAKLDELCVDLVEDSFREFGG
jgi:predicted nucleotidyltransferase